MSTGTGQSARATAEKRAYETGDVYRASNRWHSLFDHVFACPDTFCAERMFEHLVTESATGKSVLEIGCGAGHKTEKLLAMDARYALGIDIAERSIDEARKREVKGRLEFACRNLEQGLEGEFDLIYGRAILHHLDYRLVLDRLYSSNLRPGGIMIFMEPLGENLVIRLYHRLSASAHTRDEKPFFRSDVKWLIARFPGFEVIPINYLSLPFAILSSLIMTRADNRMLTFCHHADRWVARNLRFMLTRFRAAIFLIPKAEVANGRYGDEV